MRISARRARELGISGGQAVVPRLDAGQVRVDLFLSLVHAHDLPPPEPEFRFHPKRKWRFDWLFPGKVALEIDGGIYGKGKACPACGRKPPGAHSSIRQLKADREKDRAALLLGYIVVRCLPEEIQSGEIFAYLKELLEART